MRGATYKGQQYTSLQAVAKLLEPETGLSLRRLHQLLKAQNGDGDAVSEQQPKRHRRTITYNGREYPSLQVAAQELAQSTGRSVKWLKAIIRNHDGDGDAALRWCQTHRTSRRRGVSPTRVIMFEGRELSRSALARELSPRLGLPVSTIDSRLCANGNNVEQLRRDVERSRILVDGTTYPSLVAFVRELRRRYRLAPGVVRRWIKQEGLEGALAHARAYARHHRQRAQQRRSIELPVILYGWQFHSFSAMCAYYSINASKTEWEDHVLAGKSSCLFPPIAHKLAQWWELALLNEQNRWDAATEAKMPKSQLPVNPEQLPITDPMEINMLTLQASARERLEAMTNSFH
jgi:hypothetical protein